MAHLKISHFIKCQSNEFVKYEGRLGHAMPALFSFSLNWFIRVTALEYLKKWSRCHAMRMVYWDNTIHENIRDRFTSNWGVLPFLHPSRSEVIELLVPVVDLRPIREYRKNRKNYTPHRHCLIRYLQPRMCFSTYTCQIKMYPSKVCAICYERLLLTTCSCESRSLICKKTIRHQLYPYIYKPESLSSNHLANADLTWFVSDTSVLEW